MKIALKRAHKCSDTLSLDINEFLYYLVIKRDSKRGYDVNMYRINSVFRIYYRIIILFSAIYYENNIFIEIRVPIIPT